MNLRGGAAVDILTLPEGLDQGFLARDVRQDAQLDLRVVRDEQLHPLVSDEPAPNLPSNLRAHRDVLQVRVRTGQATRRRDRLVKGRVDAPGAFVDEAWQRV